jgi:hypothetical protein
MDRTLERPSTQVHTGACVTSPLDHLCSGGTGGHVGHGSNPPLGVSRGSVFQADAYVSSHLTSEAYHSLYFHGGARTILLPEGDKPPSYRCLAGCSFKVKTPSGDVRVTNEYAIADQQGWQSILDHCLTMKHYFQLHGESSTKVGWKSAVGQAKRSSTARHSATYAKKVLNKKQLLAPTDVDSPATTTPAASHRPPTENSDTGPGHCGPRVIHTLPLLQRLERQATKLSTRMTSR